MRADPIHNGAEVGAEAARIEAVAKALFDHNNRRIKNVIDWEHIEDECPGYREAYEGQAKAAIKALAALAPPPAGKGGLRDRLRELSEKATKGEWVIWTGRDEGPFQTDCTITVTSEGCTRALANLHFGTREQGQANTAFVTALVNAYRSGALRAASAEVEGAGGLTRATEITLGEGLVDITQIKHEGRVGVLFRPRAERIPFGEPGELPEGTYWPVPGDVVLWVSGEGPGVAIEHLANLTPATAIEAGTGEILGGLAPEIALGAAAIVDVWMGGRGEFKAETMSAEFMEGADWEMAVRLTKAVLAAAPAGEGRRLETQGGSTREHAVPLQGQAPDLRTVPSQPEAAGEDDNPPLSRAIAFGDGGKLVDTGKFHGRPAVFIADVTGPVGEVGTKAPQEEQGDPNTLKPGEAVLTFASMEQAQAVADVLVSRTPVPSGKEREGWVPIETAPKDGREVPCLSPLYDGPVMLRWVPRLNNVSGWRDWHNDLHYPTAYFVLPSSPAPSRQEGEL